MSKKIEIFDNFEDPQQADKERRWSMTPIERLKILEILREQMYGKDDSTTRVQRVFEVIDFPER